MRRTPFLLLLGAFALAGMVAACGAFSDASLDGADAPRSANSFDASLAPGPIVADAGADAHASLFRGSKLCNVQLVGTCDPDEDLPATLVCGPYPAADGGGGSADAGSATDAGDAASSLDAGKADASTQAWKACRVAVIDGGLTPRCALAGSVKSGSCEKSEQCASGFECSAAGICQHYCCEGLCASPDGGDGGATMFCDIQQTRELNIKLPLCALIKPCTLFAPCSKPEEACTIVTEEGATSCVTTGPAKVGDDCETVHCQAGLACIGIFGSRKCEQLCHRSMNGSTQDCPTGKCAGNPSLFPQGFGICQ